MGGVSVCGSKICLSKFTIYVRAHQTEARARPEIRNIARRGLLLSVPLLAAATEADDSSRTRLLEKYLKKSQENKAKNDKERLESYYKRNYKDYFDFVEGSVKGKKDLSESEKALSLQSSLSSRSSSRRLLLCGGGLVAAASGRGGQCGGYEAPLPLMCGFRMTAAMELPFSLGCGSALACCRTGLVRRGWIWFGGGEVLAAAVLDLMPQGLSIESSPMKNVRYQIALASGLINRGIHERVKHAMHASNAKYKARIHNPHIASNNLFVALQP
ncbi:hypothetical protein Dimus_003072 [Dionaea muscipula]